MGACVLFVCASNQLPIGDFQLFVLEVYSVHFPVPVPGGCNRIDESECEVHRSAYRGNQIDPRNGVFYTETHTHTDGGGKITVTSTTIYVSHLWGDLVQSLSSWVKLSLLGHVSMLWDGGKD